MVIVANTKRDVVLAEVILYCLCAGLIAIRLACFLRMFTLFCGLSSLMAGFEGFWRVKTSLVRVYVPKSGRNNRFWFVD